MPSHPLFSDKTIALSATLAATIGLEEAILLTVLNDAARLQSQNWARLGNHALRQHLPFWDDVTIRRVLRSLMDKGLLSLQSPLFPDGEGLIFAFMPGANAVNADPQMNQRAPQARPAQQKNPAAIQTPLNSSAMHIKEPLPAQWAPQEDTLQRLEQHGIPRSFACAQIDTFVLSGQEAGANRNDWNTRFFRHVKSQWVFVQNDAQRAQRTLERTAFNPAPDEAAPISLDWQPNGDALQILQRAGIDPQFITDAVPEFVLYWAERGDAFKTWNSKFIQHVRQQWARFSVSLDHSPLPTRISDNWQPSPDCFDILAMAHIDRRFAEQLVPEFVLYWRDSNQVHNSWNSRFLQYVKQQWGKRLAQPSGDTYGSQTSGQPAAKPGYATANASLETLLTDTSWAK
ncbi:DnaT-like ssDNA-binding domain-containing protein [Thalassolituus sp. LLYu03]|uniref:DnaT-like ssDNA-binding domain-containing protein n=1 Tax=Thalassolituus sp. LLYu03 TaxID=3421656 RepID=UPI003D29119B